jgi:hypothetical protein
MRTKAGPLRKCMSIIIGDHPWTRNKASVCPPVRLILGRQALRLEIGSCGSMRLTGSFAADGAPLLRYQPTRAATTQPHVHAAHSHNHDASGASEHRVDSGHDVTLQ